MHITIYASPLKFLGLILFSIMSKFSLTNSRISIIQFNIFSEIFSLYLILIHLFQIFSTNPDLSHMFILISPLLRLCFSFYLYFLHLLTHDILLPLPTYHRILHNCLYFHSNFLFLYNFLIIPYYYLFYIIFFFYYCF